MGNDYVYYKHLIKTGEFFDIHHKSFYMIPCKCHEENIYNQYRQACVNILDDKRDIQVPLYC